jgi:hypothetical protein
MRDTRKDFVPPQSHARRAWKSKSSVPQSNLRDDGRRPVLSARPTGEIVWHDWNNFESARLNQTIAAKVASENQFVAQYRKPKPRK